MRLDLVRTGGFANLRRPASLDTDELSREEAAEVERLVGEVDLADLAARSPLRGRGADRFQYDLTVVRDGHEQRVIAAESEMSPELQSVIEVVVAHGPRRGGTAVGSELRQEGEE